MPVTRSTGKGRLMSTETGPSTSSSRATVTTETSGTTATETTATGTTATGTTETSGQTESSQRTQASSTSVGATESCATEATGTTTRQVTRSGAELSQGPSTSTRGTQPPITVTAISATARTAPMQTPVPTTSARVTQPAPSEATTSAAPRQVMKPAMPRPHAPLVTEWGTRPPPSEAMTGTTTRQLKRTAEASRVIESTAFQQSAPISDKRDALATPRKAIAGQPVPGNNRKPTGSTKSAKAYKIAKAKEEIARLQVELATARLAVLEADSEDDEVSIYSKMEADVRVDAWLDQQAPATMAVEPHLPESEFLDEGLQQPNIDEFEDRQRRILPIMPSRQQEARANLPPEFAQLTEAITMAVKASRPRVIELPIFNGAHQEWLHFRAAYSETEKMFSRVENINRLRRNLKGKAKEAVDGLLITNADPSTIVKTLESRFGRPDSIASMEMDALRALPRLTESPRDICIFSSKVTNVVSTLRALNCAHYLYSPEVAKSMVEKLTPTLRFRYFDFSASMSREEPELLKFDNFLKKEAELCGPYAQPEPVGSQPHPTQQRRQQRVNTVTESQSIAKCPVCSDTGHVTQDCEKFTKVNESTRWDIAKNARLCFRCLRYRNKTHSCKQKTCGINNCKYYHHRMLHYTKRAENTDDNNEKQKIEVINSAWTSATRQSYLKIIPVTASGPAGAIDTYALLDDGSTVTLIDDNIANKIGATGPIDPLRIEAINDLKTAESKSRRVIITLKGANSREERIQARTVKNLHVTSQEIPRDRIRECRHLRDISDYISYEQAKPAILVGQDNWHLLLTSRTKKGGKNQPVASLTPLGWVLHGSLTQTARRHADFVNHLREDQPDESLEDLMKKYFAMDSLCINPRKPKSDPEEQALRILEKNTVHSEKERYETALLWKSEEASLPDNYDNSLRRLYGIEKKLDRDPNLKRKYTEQMEALISKGYAERAPKAKTTNRTWYLPHFGVVNPMKPEKLRVVHDAAAKTKGVSLNDLLFKGPDLLQSLPGVVMRFRQHDIAVTADIKEMFMQVKLRESDRDALRYLWRNDRRDDRPPEEYRMTSLIFGASSSPATAIFVKNLNAKIHEMTYPEAAKAIIEKHYVDDYLDSFQNLEDAIRITTQVREIHGKAGFELKQWKSNSADLLKAIGETEACEDIELYKTEEKSERVLGLLWKTEKDEFAFNLNLARIPPALIDGQRPTKREALRIVMSLFDPLGFASPVTIRAKQILQEVWRRGTAWDDPIDEDLTENWRHWLEHLRSLANVTIPRRYLHYSEATSVQLHIFTDASESAYSTVLFWRTVAPNGEVNVSLILAKAKVAPLKLTSIPRLELQAAVLGTRLAEAVIEEHERKPDSKTFWTDSRTVLAWIRTGSRSYKPYVAHRLAAIEDSSTVNEWRWVPTKLNVADDATRDVPSDLDKDHRWYKGPEFLYEPESSWPTETSPPATTDSTGEERIHHVTISEKPKLSKGLPDVSRFSSWDRLRYATARVLQFIQLCRTRTEKVHYKRTIRNKEKDPDWRKYPRKVTSKHIEQRTPKNDKKWLPLSAELLIKAEEFLMRSTQEEAFPQEIEDIEKQKPINKESRLHQLSIEYKDATLRLRSRINAAQQIPENLKSPMIIDGNHSIVKLFIKGIHRKMHHVGVEATVNECRQQYWVLRLRPITRAIVRQCLHCRMRSQSPPCPRTGDLPACRLAHHRRPFTYTGVDYFGPLTVTVGRTRQKRYVAIFTCLTTRAVHLEVAGSLSSSSAIMALRRMIARRGCPTEIWSDNGTNLKGADKELRQAIDEATTDEAAKKNISWRYIPPGAPFMGGAWERMVRSVKTALTATLHERHPTEEVLATLLSEAEYTVNSRPLTHVSVDASDPEALTPNHFLLGGPGRVPTPGNFTEKDTVSKSSWRAAQRLADIFWSRWITEYLPELQKRREPQGKGHPLQVGDLVQLTDTNHPRNTWIRGRVINTFPGPDNVVRTADIQTRNGILRRAVKKLVILPIQSDIVPAPVEGATESHGGRDVQDDAPMYK